VEILLTAFIEVTVICAMEFAFRSIIGIGVSSETAETKCYIVNVCNRCYRVLVGESEGQKPVGRSRGRWRIILRWIFSKKERGAGTGLIWPRTWTYGGLLFMR
jgi:hypothetical protein